MQPDAERPPDAADDRARPGRRPRRRRGRHLAGLIAAVLAVALLGLGAGGWFYAGEIRKEALDPAPPSEPVYRILVLAVEAGTLTLARDATSPSDLTTEGTWGVQWPNGYGQLAAIRRLQADRVERAFTRLRGSPLRVGDRVGIDGFAFPSDPRTAFGLAYQDVTYSSELGPTPAWHVQGRRATWVLFVHGYNAPQREALRLLAPVAKAGFPAMVLSYRNDPGAPPSSDRLRHWGASEWRDVEAATAYALDHGAANVVLVGYSMGGALVTSFLYQSPLAAKVRGVILDAPGLDLGAAIDHGARGRTLPILGLPVPAPLTAVAKAIASIRYHLDWSRLDYTGRAPHLATPILLFHGTADPRIPIATSQALANARPDLVTFIPVNAAGHVKSWNLDRAGYERATRAFLDRVTPAAH